jgi:3(or 17)beta-hydroxysteroid dehydrogenase
MTELVGKVALITGGGAGFGLATAQLLEQRGATVWTADLKNATFVLDVTDEGGWRDTMSAVLARSGALDILSTPPVLAGIATRITGSLLRHLTTGVASSQ